MTYNKLSAGERQQIRTLGELKASGYTPRPVKQELRDNLIEKIRLREPVFSGIWGYENTVVPDVERAILSMHDINFLGLRGQAKTRMARLMVHLLDEYMPVLEGSELNEDPLAPLTSTARKRIAEEGDDTPVAWLHRSERYTEKLATPDVSVADLIGDVDPIKAATLKLSYADERVIHFGLIPRAHRGIFVVNELPDLQARIQVALFNILQEGDIQIRGFKLRLPLDIQFVFTANPEDYTNRGSIVTPLKDRIGSQIVTHYPLTIETGKKITGQEAHIQEAQQTRVRTNELIRDLIEQVAVEARSSEYVDEKSGVSARMTISAYENLMSAAELRILKNDEQDTYVRVSDLFQIVPAICGKVELVYEGEVEGPVIVARNLIGKAIRTCYLKYFPDPEKLRRQENADRDKDARRGNASRGGVRQDSATRGAARRADAPQQGAVQTIIDWFGSGNQMSFPAHLTNREYRARLSSIDGLDQYVDEYLPGLPEEERLFMMEYALHGLAEFSRIGRTVLNDSIGFQDLVNSMFLNEQAMRDIEDMMDDEEDEDI